MKVMYYYFIQGLNQLRISNFLVLDAQTSKISKTARMRTNGWSEKYIDLIDLTKDEDDLLTNTITSKQLSNKSRLTAVKSTSTTVKSTSTTVKSTSTTVKSTSTTVKSTSNENSFRCAICLDILALSKYQKPIMATICGHVFCKWCINQVFKISIDNQINCPTCRSKLNQKEVFDLFL